MLRFSLCIFIVLISGLLKADAPTNLLGNKIIALSSSWEQESKRLREYVGLSGFCMDAEYRGVVYGLLNEIHYYHSLLYTELTTTSHQHDEKKMKLVLRELEMIEQDYNIDSFNDFFRERCRAQTDLEDKSDHYKSGFGVHSYHGKIYVLEEELHGYLKKFAKRIGRVKNHVIHLHLSQL